MQEKKLAAGVKGTAGSEVTEGDEYESSDHEISFKSIRGPKMPSFDEA